MATDRNAKDINRLQGLLDPTAVITLWTLDLWPLRSSDNEPAQRYIRFTNDGGPDGGPVMYGGLGWYPLPCDARGFSIATSGVPPSPSITVSNIGLSFSTLINTWDDLVGAKMYRRRVLRDYLDDGSNPDPNGHWPDDVFYVEQKANEDKLTVTFTLSTAFELDGVQLPRRRLLRYTCPFTYRGPNCGYSGPPVATAKDERLNTSNDGLLQDFYNKQEAYRVAIDTRNWQAGQVGRARDELTAAQNSEWIKLEERYDTSGSKQTWALQRFNSRTQQPIGWTVLWDGSFIGGNVAFGDVYRLGRYQGKLYAVQRWGPSTAAINAAQNKLDQENATYASTVNNVNVAYQQMEDARNTYLSQPHPQPDPRDQCGKRLSSCRLRFYDPINRVYAPLPFGGFPGLIT